MVGYAFRRYRLGWRGLTVEPRARGVSGSLIGSPASDAVGARREVFAVVSSSRRHDARPCATLGSLTTTAPTSLDATTRSRAFSSSRVLHAAWSGR